MDALLASTTFIRWSIPHLAVLFIALTVAISLLAWGSRLSLQGRYTLCRVLAIVLAVDFAGEYTWRAFSDSYGPWQDNLPLHFCSIMTVISIIALWWRRHWACAMVYFGVLTASIQGLITPALTAGFPSVPFFIFFTSHSLLLVVALAIPVLLGWRARAWDDLRSVLRMDIYLVLIIPINVWLGTNYGYTQGSPVEGCLLDYLGPAPWYYLWLQLPAWALFHLLMLFVRGKRKA